MVSPVKLSLVGRACSLTACVPPTLCWGHSLTDMYAYLSLSLGQWSLWSGAGLCRGCLYAARLASVPWVGSGQESIGEGESIEAQCGRLGSNIIKLSMPGLCTRGPVALGLKWAVWRDGSLEVHRRVSWGTVVVLASFVWSGPLWE